MSIVILGFGIGQNLSPGTFTLTVEEIAGRAAA
jgi:hypothetical protein